LPVLRAEGFVLKSLPLGEADKIVTLLTREEGKIRGVAKSARKSRRRFGSSLEPWSRVSLTLFEKENSELGRLDACDLLESAYRLQESLETAFLLAYMAEISDLFSRDRQPEPHYFRLLGTLIDGLRQGLSNRTALRYFEVWTLKLHGLLPDLAHCSGCGASMSGEAIAMEAHSGRILCRRCLLAEASPKLILGSSGRRALEEILHRHPSDLVGRKIDAEGTREIGRWTTAALCSFAEAGFRSARFLAILEGAAP
jgi:DNA repair protein RecO (recombination protein O)